MRSLVVCALLLCLAPSMVQADPCPAFLLKWGTPGTEDGQFNGLEGVAVGPSGEIYVVDQGNHRIHKFDAWGVFLGDWGSYGTGDGQLDLPYGIGVDRVTGDVYVADDPGRIQKFTSDGVFLLKWGTHGMDAPGELWAPKGIAVGRDGNVFVADYTNRIQKFDSSGNFLLQWSWGTYFVDVAADRSGNIYAITRTAARLLKYDEFGTMLAVWDSAGFTDGRFEDPKAIDTDSTGNVYVYDAGLSRIQKFDSNGTFLCKWGWHGTGDGGFMTVQDIAVTPTGSVYTVEHSQNRVQMFVPSTVDVGERPLGRVALGSVVPNPVEGKSSFTFDLPRPAEVSINVTDVSGRAVRTLSHGPRPAGSNLVSWDGRDNHGARVGAGIYFIKLRGTGLAATTKVVVAH